VSIYYRLHSQQPLSTLLTDDDDGQRAANHRGNRRSNRLIILPQLVSLRLVDEYRTGTFELNVMYLNEFNV
jgi:hypothetical protein